MTMILLAQQPCSPPAYPVHVEPSSPSVQTETSIPKAKRRLRVGVLSKPYCAEANHGWVKRLAKDYTLGYDKCVYLAKAFSYILSDVNATVIRVLSNLYFTRIALEPKMSLQAMSRRVAVLPGHLYTFIYSSFQS